MGKKSKRIPVCVTKNSAGNFVGKAYANKHAWHVGTFKTVREAAFAVDEAVERDTGLRPNVENGYFIKEDGKWIVNPIHEDIQDVSQFKTV